MLTRNQKSKMVYCLKEYFGKRLNELKNSLYVNNNTLENFKSKMKSEFQTLEDKIDNKIKGLESGKNYNISTNSFLFIIRRFECYCTHCQETALN